MGYKEGELIVNPTVEQREGSKLELIVSGTKDAIMMVEAGAGEVSEELMIEAILTAHEEIKKIVAFQEQIIEQVGKQKREVQFYLPSTNCSNGCTNEKKKMDAALRTLQDSTRKNPPAVEKFSIEIRRARRGFEGNEEQIAQAIEKLENPLCVL
jgi:polyribonucleotide nucleotidyltransferase